MKGISVLTLVRNREPHLEQLMEGLRRSTVRPDELIIVDMSDRPLPSQLEAFPVKVDRLVTNGLPLATARNRAASLARYNQLVFLDVDCIPMRDCLGRLSAALQDEERLLCADVRYLGPDVARGIWSEAELLERGQAHPQRSFPNAGLRREQNPGLFWSLAFAIRRETFSRLLGFDERFVGYGAEDTDFGFRTAAADVPLYFVGGAVACHQHHDSHEPPVQHLRDIVQNARLFHAHWGQWPMQGWLDRFASMGLIALTPRDIELLRLPTSEELSATRTAWPISQLS
jgi:GT2 family glycosyltransferase